MRNSNRSSNLITAAIALFLLTGCGDDTSRDGGETEFNSALHDELVALAEQDQRDRQGLMAAAAARDTAAMLRIQQADLARSIRMAEIIEAHGWPGTSLVGQEGADAAFLLVQHSPSDGFQKQVLPLLTEAAQNGEASKEQMALLTDRVLVQEGLPQRYGTQAAIMGGEIVLEPIEDPENVDARRAELGLMPLAEYVALLERTYLRPAEPEEEER